MIHTQCLGLELSIYDQKVQDWKRRVPLSNLGQEMPDYYWLIARLKLMVTRLLEPGCYHQSLQSLRSSHA